MSNLNSDALNCHGKIMRHNLDWVFLIVFASFSSCSPFSNSDALNCHGKITRRNFKKDYYPLIKVCSYPGKAQPNKTFFSQMVSPLLERKIFERIFEKKEELALRMRKM